MQGTVIQENKVSSDLNAGFAVRTVENSALNFKASISIPAPHIDKEFIESVELTQFETILKRSFDIFTSLFALLVFSVPMVVLACLIKISSRGPIFYGQERVGLRGKVFKMWKFRSMRVNSEEDGAVWAIKDDPRRTRFGVFLRSSSLDELPQLWNVLVGDMSMVGPRPERPVFVDFFKQNIPYYDLRHQMKTGITGWAQVCGWRGNTSIEKRVQYDLFYIKRWSIFFDVKILFLTLFRGFINKNAY